MKGPEPQGPVELGPEPQGPVAGPEDLVPVELGPYIFSLAGV